MKIALVHELLTMKGGAERVTRIAADMFPDAPIYTLLYDEKKLGEWFPKERVRTSKVQKWAKRLKNFNHHLYLPWFPSAVQEWDFSEYDIVLSFSSAFAHGIITNGTPKHVCYVHSPARYLWDRTHDVQARAGASLCGRVKKKYLETLFHKLRAWDAEVAPRPDTILAASKAVQRRIQLYWERESTVVYPPIDDFWLQEPMVNDRAREEYYFIASTLVPYKRIDIAIETCNALQAPLKIAGSGPDMSRLKKLAGPTVEFLGYTEQEELRRLFANAKATLFPGDEDFGLVPLESMACGTPVIAYANGGALETVEPGKTGELFTEPTGLSLQKTMEECSKNTYNKQTCRNTAEQYSVAHFKEELAKHVTL